MSEWTRRTFLAALGAAAAGCRTAVPDPVSGPGVRPPNVLVVLPDQLRASALGCMGNPVVRTPNADRLAAEGALFTNVAVNSPICPAARAQLMTGRMTRTSVPGRANPLMANMAFDEEGLAEVLKARGYATGYVGKWHLTPRDIVRDDGFVPPGAARQGFDDWAAVEIPRGHYDTFYYRDTPEPVQIEGFACPTETDLAIRFIEKHTAETNGEPFFLMVSWNPPHNPYTPPPEYDVYVPEEVPVPENVPRDWRRPAREAMAKYYGLVAAVDDNLGRLLDALDDAGITEDTVVLFCSDHGDMLFSQHDHWQEGHKKRPWRESRNVPFIFRYPRALAGGQRHDDLVSMIDVMPTLLGLAGHGPAASCQGIDFSPLLRGESFKTPESVFLYMEAFSHSAAPFNAPWRAVLTRHWLFAVSAGVEGGDWLLYDLVNDPFETRNLVADPDHRDVKARLKSILHDHRRHYGDMSALRRRAG